MIHSFLQLANLFARSPSGKSFMPLSAGTLLCYFLLLPRISGLVHETRRQHHLWKRADDATGPSISDDVKHHARLPLKFRLRQNNIERLHVELMSVSDPHQESYGDFWSPEKVADFFSPSPESQKAVLDWLYGHGIGVKADDIDLDSQRGWIQFSGTIKQAEELLETTYHLYSNPRGGTLVGCESYSLPDHLAHHIDMVTPTVHFPPTHKTPHNSPVSEEEISMSVEATSAPSRRSSRRTVGYNIPKLLAKCDRWMNAVCLGHMYKFSDYTPVASLQNSFGIISFAPLKLSFEATDLLYKATSPHVVGARPRVTLLNSEGIPNPPGTPSYAGDRLETEMDVEYSLPLIYPTPVDVYQVPIESQESIEPFEPIFEALDCHNQSKSNSKRTCILRKPPNVITISYGMSEISSPPSALIRQCNEYAKLGLMGTTVVVASGDSGVAGHDGRCIDSSHKLGGSIGRFAPDFPASCPYVTAVGGTRIPEGKTWRDREIPINLASRLSGGGFSDVFPMPFYQKDTVEKWFREHNPSYPAGTFNDSRNARAYPDISANGWN